MSIAKPIPFKQLLDQLLDSERPLPSRYFYSLSDIEGEDLKLLSEAWMKIPLWRRQAIMEDIENLSGEDMLLSFVDMASVAAVDEDAGVRLRAIRSLWEYEEHRLAPLFMKTAIQDSDAAVRASAAGALGRFVYAGELDELPMQTLRKIEELLLGVVQGEDEAIVRRSALEALGYSSRDEVQSLIKKAYASKEKAWLASALFAMGRSGDESWKPQVLAMLEHPHTQVRAEAARAAGELEIHEAAPTLVELLDDPDDDIRLACIWSLSQIGGEGVQEILENLAEELEDEESLNLLEEALENLNFNESMPLMPLLDLADTAEEDDSELDDLDIGAIDLDDGAIDLDGGAIDFDGEDIDFDGGEDTED